MSVNISLGDTPGVSAYFDGQPIQDELEAEIRREEERQDKELRDLLATELEDFEEDFLSDSNSDEDSVNVSRISRASTQSQRIRQNEERRALQQTSDKLVQLAPDSSRREQVSDKGRIAESANEAYFSPVSRNRPGPSNPQPQQLLHKHQQNLLQQHHHHHHQHSQDTNQNHQGQFIPSSQYDSVPQHHDIIRSMEVKNVFPSYDEDGDDWMMRVQQTHAVTVPSSSPYQPQTSHLHQQQQHQFFSPLPHPINTGMVDNPPLPVPNHVRNMQPQQQQQQPGFHSPVVKSSLSQPSISNAIPVETSTPILSTASVMAQDNAGKNIVSGNKDDFDNYQVQYKSKQKRSDLNENDFFIQNENVEFFRAEGGEEKRSYQQLEVLYRARGRELEDLTWKLKHAEEEAAKEARMYKHKLALSNGDLEGGQESLRHCQSLLQQTKSELTESQALVRALETQVASLKEAKEELIKKLQVAESTIENLSHQCEELQQSESLSRARNEHEKVVSSLSQRFERELLSLKEKLDEMKSNFDSKHDETVWLKKQLADSTKELEQAQISRGETINRLAKSLEDSQRQCQALLEQSSSQEIASLKVKLQQSIASKSVSEETCIGLQSEIKELKEQLSMFESASALGAVSSTSVGVSSHNKVPGTGLDDSMTDLGIKKTLDFDTPSSTPKMADTSSLEELVTSLRSELEKCLYSNRQKRSEITEKAGEILLLKQDLQLSQSKSQDLEKTCLDQKMKLTELESLMSNSNGESIVEVRLRRDLEALAKEKAILLEDIEDYKKRLEEVGASEARLTEINTELSAQIAQMVSDFDSDKATALDRCQRTLEEVHHMTVNNLRAELENRLASEKSMVAECHKMELDRIKDLLNTAQEEAHSVKSLYIQACDEMKKQEEETRSLIRKEVEEELTLVSRCKDEAKETAMMQEEKNKRLCIEENFSKEKDTWNEKKDLYEKEIKASKDIIAEMKSSHEKDVSDLQETISSLKSQHKEEMNVLDDRLAHLMSSHQLEIKKMQDESSKLSKMKIHFESKLELTEKQYKAEKEGLENLLQEEKKSKLVENSVMSKVGHDVSVLTSCVETEENSTQTDVCKEIAHDDDAEDCPSKKLILIQAELHSMKNEHLVALENLKTEHKKEFERAARNREEKFQVELRYFLKDKDDRFKEKLDQALKKSEEGAKLEYERRIKEKETEIDQLKKEIDGMHLTATDENKGTMTSQDHKMLEDVIEKLNVEKSVMERKIQELELEKKEELCKLIEKHEKEEKALVEKYSNEIEVITLKHREECAELHQKIEEFADRQRKTSEDDSSGDEVRKIVSARIREERAKWFKDAQEYIKNEIESGIADRKQQGSGDEVWTRKLNEEVKRNVETELDRMKVKMELEIEKGVDQRMREELAKEKKRLKSEGEKKDEDHKKMIDSQVKQKLSIEVENLKVKFLSELEARVSKEKDQLEQDVRNWKKKIDGDKELLIAKMNREMEMKVAEERKKVEQKIMQGRQEELRQMRNEMEEEMRKRIEREKMDWKKEEEDWKRMNEGGVEDAASMVAVRDRLRAAEEACNKARMERERAVELLKKREALYKEDKQKLVAGLKQLRQDLNATKEEQALLEGKCVQMDSKYKEDMREAKKKKELALEKLQAKCDEDKEKIIMDFQGCMASMKEDFHSEVEKVKSEAEMERAALLMELHSHAERALTISPSQEPDSETTTLFELRDHYLETVTKIKEDVMSHVQAANSRAATTMKSEMRKQRRRLIQVFKERCKATIHSILTGQVSPNVLNSLDQAVDLIAEAMVMTPKSATSNITASSPSNGTTPNTAHDNRNMNQAKNPVERFQGVATRQERGDHSLNNHPQLAKVDLYDSEAVDSSPQTSHNSSPASITLRTKSFLQSTNKAVSSPRVPHLDLSPFHSPKEMEHSMTPSEEQQGHNQHIKGYANKARQNHNRPRSAESSSQTPQAQDLPSDLHQKITKTGAAKNTDEPSPRDRMKMIEAQVRLANWAASGEMPWTGSGSKEGVEKQKGGDFENEDNLFVRPGEEAERFLKAQRSMKMRDGQLVTPMKKDKIDRNAVSQPFETPATYQKMSSELDGYLTDDSSVSYGSHSSFVTLEPDANQRSQLSIHNSKGKDWTMYTTDYDRIKSAVFEHPDKTYMNVTQRRAPRMLEGGLSMSSDEDAKSVDSDDVPHYRGLPTSTPTKKGDEEHGHHSKSHYGSKNIPGKRRPEKESQGWKTVNAFSEYPVSRTLHREQRQEKRSYSQPRPSKSQAMKQNHREMTNAKSIDFEFADISEITQASGDVPVGGKMWRYKSLEDLLPHHAKGRLNTNESGNNPDRVAPDFDMKQLSVARMAPPPIQAMNSDFWREQSLEDDNYDDEHGKRIDHLHHTEIPDYRENPQSTAYHQQAHHHKSHSHANRKVNKHNDDYDYGHSKKGHSRPANSKHAAEPSWSNKQINKNPINPSYSSSPAYPVHSQSRNKHSGSAQQRQHTPAFSSQFDAHVDDLRKSLETLEANPFSSMSKQKSKSKMKRSVSEQSLHTIQWDQDRSADIDDLVNAYTADGMAISHFDLHNFGHEEAF